MSAIPAAAPLANVHSINASPALMQAYPMQPAAVPVQQPRYAIYDKPADRRLRPWILLGSVFLGVCFIFLPSHTLLSFT